jgi:hypothetical protein
MALHIDIALRRNEDWARAWTVRDRNKVAVDLTGWAVDMQVRSRLDNNALLAAATCAITDPAAGIFTTVIRASEGFPLSTYGDPLHTISLPYDIRLTDPAGIRVVLVAGLVTLSRGISHS